MKNRFSRMGKTLLGAVCLLSMGGIAYSCSDDYDLDETMPSFLGGSIYDELKAKKFTTVVRLIEDLGYDEVLAKTGSKTLFAASDEAYDNFFKNNTSWPTAENPVKSYEELSKAQKRWLLNGSMLNSAYVLEMMANNGSEKNVCLRQGSALSVVDTIRNWRPEELPENFNVPSEDGSTVSDKKFWEPFRNDTRSLIMATDKTAPMLTHFLEGNMKEKNITRSDVSFVLNDTLNGGWKDTDGDRSYIYGSRILKQDITCLNGYIHELDSVLLTPMNMAEIIRINPETKYFSALLERFSAPYYDYNLHMDYTSLHPIDEAVTHDSVLYKRYISQQSIGNTGIINDPNGEPLGKYPSLLFDPGWNQYSNGVAITKEEDMAAMFVPCDDAMWTYFSIGGGKLMMDRYAKYPNTKENFIRNLHQIPLDLVSYLINNLMKKSFMETVPSKYRSIKNDAQDYMFDDYKSETEYRTLIKKCLLANNGVVYLMKSVIAPADFSAVIAPVLYSKNTQIMKSVISADENFIKGDDYDRAPLKLYYSTYLKAMKSRFSLFVPTDEGLKDYGLVDPMSMAIKEGNARYYRLVPNSVGVDDRKGQLPIDALAYKYNIETGQQPTDIIKSKEHNSPATEPVNRSRNDDNSPDKPVQYGTTKRTLLVDMVDQHILVHDSVKMGIETPNMYFKSRGGAPVIFLDKGDAKGKGIKVMGGFQKELAEDAYPGNDHICEVKTAGYDLTAETNKYGNGMTYFLDRPMQPTTLSVYDILKSDPDFSYFKNLASISMSGDELELIGLRPDSASKDEWSAMQKVYRILTDLDVNPKYNGKLVRFFNNYQYTIYVPTNDAIQQAFDAGLPSADEIHDFIDDHKSELSKSKSENPEEKAVAIEYQLKAQAMLKALINFVKYHFQDQSVYVDKVLRNSEREFTTSCVNDSLKIYLPLGVKQSDDRIVVVDNDQMNHTDDPSYKVNDNWKTDNSLGVEVDGTKYNLLARDCNFENTAPTYSRRIANSSYVVLHKIDRVLNFMDDFTEKGGRYDSEWADTKSAKAFLTKYRTLK